MKKAGQSVSTVVQSCHFVVRIWFNANFFFRTLGLTLVHELIASVDKALESLGHDIPPYFKPSCPHLTLGYTDVTNTPSQTLIPDIADNGSVDTTSCPGCQGGCIRDVCGSGILVGMCESVSVSVGRVEIRIGCKIWSWGKGKYWNRDSVGAPRILE